MLLLLSGIFLTNPAEQGLTSAFNFCLQSCQMLSVHAYTCGGKKLHDQHVSPEANVSRFPFIFFNLSGFSTLLVTTCLLKGVFI